MCDNGDAPRIRQGERERYLKEHPELVPAGKLRRRGLRAPAEALVYNCNAHEYQPWCDPAKAVPLPDEELEWRREARRVAEMRRRARLRCPACGRTVAKTLRDARAACLRDGLWHEWDDRVILCPDCRRERDEARERARRIALEERRAALASAAKEPVPHVEGPLPAIIVLDTETTGLSSRFDHLLTVGICDGDGQEVACFKICPPAECCEWPEAEEVNGISPADTVAWPAIEDVVPELQRILDAAEAVIGYNVWFDLEFLRASRCRIAGTSTSWPCSRPCSGCRTTTTGDTGGRRLSPPPRTWATTGMRRGAQRDSGLPHHPGRAALAREARGGGGRPPRAGRAPRRRMEAARLGRGGEAVTKGPFDVANGPF